MNERDRALQILRRIEAESLFASFVLAGESGFVRTLVLGVLRWRSRLDFVIETLAQRKLSRLDPVVVEILRLGIVQLGFMDVAPHAAVSETVDLAGRHAKRARGFVNAILRRASERLPEPADPATRFAHPRWLYERWEANYGADRAQRIAEANQQLSFPDVLVLEGEAPAGSETSQLVDHVAKMSGTTKDLDRKRFYPMDEGSAVIASIAATAGNDILDLAAAPGGKTLYMRMRGAKVVSNDVSLARLRPLVGRTDRIVVSDGTRPPFRRRFQTVLLDAPCSATGTIRKNPELKWRLAERDIRDVVPLQRALLETAMSLAEQTVVYSTCSLEPEENDEVIAGAARSGFRRIDVTPFAPAGARPWIEDGVLRLTPESGSDGFTAFVLERSR